MNNNKRQMDNDKRWMKNDKRLNAEIVRLQVIELLKKRKHNLLYQTSHQCINLQ